MSLTNVIKSVGIIGLVLSPLACGAIAYNEIYKQHPPGAYGKKDQVLTREGMNVEYRVQEGLKGDVLFLWIR